MSWSPNSGKQISRSKFATLCKSDVVRILKSLDLECDDSITKQKEFLKVELEKRNLLAEHSKMYKQMMRTKAERIKDEPLQVKREEAQWSLLKKIFHYNNPTIQICPRLKVGPKLRHESKNLKKALKLATKIRNLGLSAEELESVRSTF